MGQDILHAGWTGEHRTEVLLGCSLIFCRPPCVYYNLIPSWIIELGRRGSALGIAAARRCTARGAAGNICRENCAQLQSFPNCDECAAVRCRAGVAAPPSLVSHYR